MLPFLPLALPVLGIAAVTKFHLSGENLKKYDRDEGPTFRTDPDSPGHKAVADYLVENFIKPAAEGKSKGEALAAKRQRFERMGLERDFSVIFQPETLEWGDLTIPGEWVLTDSSDPDRRILYIHGGAFTVGSPISHRAITSDLAKRTGCAVLAIDYRLMPENPRMASVQDCRASYQWIRENGPNGPAPVKALAFGGDSAGGNLTLSLSNWVRDTGLPPADAVFAMSPATDGTFSSPSIKGNLDTDLMLQPLVKPLLKIPRSVLLWMSWKSLGMSPASPAVSPIFADLNDLPPTLIHVSTSEMLYDDAARYVVKAQMAGSPVTIQSWDHVCHVWHAFDRMLPEAGAALDEIAKFVMKHGVKGKKIKLKKSA